MTADPEPVGPAAVVGDYGVAIVHCAEAFTFVAGHRLRAASCLVCGQLIGGQFATLIGAAALMGDPCTCGGVVSDVFLVHADHLPMDSAELQAAITRGLQCDGHSA